MPPRPRVPHPKPEPRTLAPEDRAALLAVDPDTKLTAFQMRQCRHCGGVHDRACYRVKRIIERTIDGVKTTEVEYFPEWHQPYVIWPEHLGVLDEEVGGK